MEINDSMKKKPAGLSVGSTPARAAKGTDKSSGATPTSPDQPDSVHLSSQLQALGSHGSDSGSFDIKKVEEIKAAIAGGKFEVNTEKVANGLLQTVKDLLHARTA